MSTNVSDAARPETAPQSAAAPHAGRYYRRFGFIERLMHAGLMFTFIGCALSGLPLLFPYTGWGRALAALMGGFEGAALVHRVSATVMVIVFVSHIFQFLWRGLASGNILSVLWGPDSLMPQPKDIVDLYQHVKYFLGLGPRPNFDRYTYWEKFDYMAVFWGMFIIGGSGLMLWFAVPLSHYVPGWMFNVATLVHGEEALLAVGFIFTIHFFNGHVRPEKFPMDLVIFTGRVAEHELKEERPEEYARLVREGRLVQIETTPPSARAIAFGRAIGGTALVLGIVTIVLILYGLLVG
jgi:cytochrome b subunit of formate dehydrogenase